MRRLPTPLPSTAALALAALLAMAPLPAAHATAAPGGVAWQDAAADADIERLVAQAKAERKPLLLYWGAAWCPPCNQLKATLFNRADFIERSKSFVAVNLDGDLPGAQALGARFKVRGYPTMILMSPEGQEITRLPGEAEAPQVLRLLQQGLAGGRPAKALLADAQAGKRLSANEWRSLAWYGWDIDEAQLVDANERPALLAKLSAACARTEPAAATRLLLKALADSDDGKGLKPDAALRRRVTGLLGDAAASRAQADVLVNASADIVRALAPEPGRERQALVAAFDAALKRLQADTTLWRGDRQSALASRVLLARVDAPKDERHPALPAPLLAEVKAQAARDDREITNGYERQAVITGDAWILAQAGLWAESDALLKANLAKSHSPYYLMSELADNARKLGRVDDALGWYAKAFDASVGPATRLQWGASYVSALVELAPQDAATIEKVALQLVREAGADRAAFAERSGRSMKRVGEKLEAWRAAGAKAADKAGEKSEARDAVVARLKAALAPVCAKVDAADGQRARCEAVIKA